jgi:hypothetical protein
MKGKLPPLSGGARTTPPLQTASQDRLLAPAPAAAPAPVAIPIAADPAQLVKGEPTSISKTELAPLNKIKIISEPAQSTSETLISDAPAPSPTAAEDEEDKEKAPPQDIEESMRNNFAAISERGETAKVSESERGPMWAPHDELFDLPDGSAWPDLAQSDAGVYDWVFDKGTVLTRCVTWNLMASPPPEHEVTSLNLIPKNR